MLARAFHEELVNGCGNETMQLVVGSLERLWSAQTRQLTDRIDRLLGIQAATQSIGLLGRTVDISTATGTQSGQVTSLSFANGQPELTLRTSGGDNITGITISQVVSVR